MSANVLDTGDVSGGVSEPLQAENPRLDVSLNTSVDSTMRLSHIIEQQQKNLIAKRAHGANENSRTSFIVLEKIGDKPPTTDDSEDDDVDADAQDTGGSGLEKTLVKPGTMESSLSESSVSSTPVPVPATAMATATAKISSLKRLINDVDQDVGADIRNSDIHHTTVTTTVLAVSDDDNDDDDEGTNAPPEFARLSRPGSAKRLKRNNVPNPLDFTTFNGRFGPSEELGANLHPAIQSAPIRVTSFNSRPSHDNGHHHHANAHNRRVQYAAPYGGTYHAYTPVHSRPMRPYPIPVNGPMVYPHSQFSAMASAFPYGQPLQPISALPQRIAPSSLRRARMPHPHTTTATHFPRHITVDARRPGVGTNGHSNISININSSGSGSKDDTLGEATTPKSSRSKTVTDVFVGDLEKAAPLQSQPLSAQKEYFWLNRNAAIANGSSPYKRTSREGDEVTESEISEMQHKYRTAAAEGSLAKHEVFGSINLMNEKIFNFRIFGNGDSASGDSETDTSSGSPEDKEREWLSREKHKFLKICETSWDEYVVSRTT